MKVPDGADVPLEEAEAPAVQGDPATQPVLAHFYYRAIDHSALKKTQNHSSFKVKYVMPKYQ